MLLRKVRRYLSMFLQKLLLMKLRKLVRLVDLILHEQQQKVMWILLSRWYCQMLSLGVHQLLPLF
jgi:hypothetical protein